MGCNHKPNRAQQFCARYGEYLPELGVKITVFTSQPWWWTAVCNACPDFHVMSIIQDDVVAAAMEHHKSDHPRDLVAFSVHD